MLLQLSIQNYALIRHLEIDFASGLTVITGETGAGKSILLGALDLILGKRADTKVLMDKTVKCIVEGTFESTKTDIISILSLHDLDPDNPMIIRREINPQGKSRAFVNDTPVTLNILKELGEKLIDIHSQHQSLNLNDSSFQFSLLDNFAGISDKVKKFNDDFDSFKKLKDQLAELENEESKAAAEKDYLEFLFAELDNANLQPDELESLEHEQKILDHAEEIKSTLLKSTQLISNEEAGVIQALTLVNKDLSKLGNYDQVLKELADRISSSFIEIEDIAAELEKYEAQVSFDSGRVAEVTERLNLINSLLRKHNVTSMADLLDVKSEIEKKINEGQSLQNQINALKKTIDKECNLLNIQADAISKARKNITTDLQLQAVKILQSLGIPNARFMVDVSDAANLNKYGKNVLQFLFNANRGGELQEVASVASGGEKSRLMLAMKSLLSHKNILPTIIFDEIDAGVSGLVADKVGDILEVLSESMQVIAITHLPQIAGKGRSHYLVFKEETDGITQTFIRDLLPEERVMEIAKMMSGKKLSSATVESARDLLNN